jgi:hypothetical protein
LSPLLRPCPLPLPRARECAAYVQYYNGGVMDSLEG